METTTTVYIKVLRREFALRESRNPRYSLRSFARDLDFNQGDLSRVMSLKLGLTLKGGKKIIEKLSLSREEKYLFLKSIVEEKAKKGIDEIKQYAVEEPIL